MPILSNIATLASCRPQGGQHDIHAVADAALAWEGERIRWVGPASELPREYAGWEQVDAGGCLVVPGLIDCHTHLAFGGWRSGEFERRIQGAGYLQIAREGGGIASTVRSTRRQSQEQLLQRCLGFLSEMSQLGVTTVECKSGYGLSVEEELKQLRVYRQLDSIQPLTIVPTFLAHIVAPEYRSNRSEYLRLLTDEAIPQAAEEGLARFCDVFLEDTAFGREEACSILQAGIRCGLRPRIHADQMSAGGGAELAAELRAASADHLECISEQGIESLADSRVAAVSLPLASLYLGQPAMPARRLIEAGAEVCVATDFNPGSAPSFHLPLAMLLACNLQRMTPAETLKGVTIYAAKAVGLEDSIGSLEAGKRADFALIDAEDVNSWLYHFRANSCIGTFVAGRRIAGPDVSRAAPEKGHES